MALDSIDFISVLDACLFIMFFCELWLFYTTERELSKLEVKLRDAENA